MDLSHLPSQFGASDVQIFNALSTTDWQIWRKPRGKTTALMICVGAGSGGGGGMTGAAGTARGGGGGGGSAAMARLTIPLIFLPDILYCNVGLGGAGGAATLAGGAGVNSFIQLNTVAGISQNRVLQAGSTVATGGSPGTVATGGAAGAAQVIGAASQCPFSCLGSYTPIAGQIGAVGGAQTGAVGASITWGATAVLISGGAGGGGTPTANTDFAGGDITGSNWFPSIFGGAAAAGPGVAGFSSMVPWGNCGGSGGGTAGAAGTAGVGGDAAIGSGGGGGGGGVTGGAGGRGGHGLIIIVCW